MRLSTAEFSAGAQVYGEVGSEDKWSQPALTSRAAILAGVYTPQVFLEDFLQRLSAACGFAGFPSDTIWESMRLTSSCVPAVTWATVCNSEPTSTGRNATEDNRFMKRNEKRGRIRNPGQITSINLFVETFVTDVTSNNHFLWRNLGVQF